MCPKIGPFKIVKMLASTRTIDKDDVSVTVYYDSVALTPTPITIQHVVDNANNCHKDRFPTDAIGKHIHATNAEPQNVVYDKSGQNAMEQTENTRTAMPQTLTFENEEGNEGITTWKYAMRKHATWNRRCKHASHTKGSWQYATRQKIQWKNEIYNVDSTWGTGVAKDVAMVTTMAVKSYV